MKSDLIKLVQSIGFDGSRENKGNMSKSPQESDLNFSRGDVLEISKYTNAKTLDQRTIAKIKAVLLAGLYPNIAKVSHIERIDAHVNPELNVCVGVSAQGPVHVHPSSVNRFLQANGWLVFHQKVCITQSGQNPIYNSPGIFESYFLTSQPKHILLVLKRTVSRRRFF